MLFWNFWVVFWYGRTLKMWYRKIRVTSYVLLITSWKLKSTNWNSKVFKCASSNSWVTSSILRPTGSTSYEFKSRTRNMVLVRTYTWGLTHPSPLRSNSAYFGWPLIPHEFRKYLNWSPFYQPKNKKRHSNIVFTEIYTFEKLKVSTINDSAAGEMH